MTPSTRARKTDPDTSHQAADAQEPKLRPSQARVLAMFKLYGDLHDKQLQAYLHDMEKAAGFKKLMSPSGIRSRRSELSKNNEERLRQLRTQFYIEHGQIPAQRAGAHWTSTDDQAARAPITVQEEAAIEGTRRTAAEEWARRTLRIEGFRSPLWDTGRREKVDGHNVIVWGLAR